MKKIIILLMMISFGLTGCTPYVSVDQSIENFNVYEQRIEESAKEYGYKVVEEPVFDSQSKRILIPIDNKSEMSIYIYNSSYGEEKGRERVNIEYLISNNEKEENNFNLDLFVAVVNSVSGKEIDQEMCDEFLRAPESEYSLELYGLEKDDDMQRQKLKFLNFFEDWSLEYSVDSEYNETLLFWGLTQELK